MLLRSFRYALAGALYMLRTQRNASIESAFGLAAFALGYWLGLTTVEWAVFVLTVALVIGLEWLNTSLELAVTLASPETHPLAKAAKDVAAAGVLVGAVAAVCVGPLLFGPRIVFRFVGP